KNAAFVRQIMWEVYDAIGDHETAWKVRATVLRELGTTTSSRTQTTVYAIAQEAARRQQWRIAVSMLNLELQIGRTVRRADQNVLAYLRRAVAKWQLGDSEGA